jgi:Stigma-specific protein, Stig1
LAARSRTLAILGVIATLSVSCGTAGDVLTPLPVSGGACPPARLLCNQGCVDLQSDANNCGACGHECLGTACALGLCAPTLVASGRADSAAGALASNGSIIYWHDNAAHAVMSMDLLQNSPTVLAADVANVFWMSINGNTLAASTYQLVPNQVIRVPLAGGNPVSLATEPVTLEGVALDDTYAYFTTDEMPDNGSLWRVPLAGGATETLLSSIKANVIALDADQVYFTSYGPGRVLKVPKIGGIPTVLADNQPGPWHVVVSAGYAYWTNHYGDTIMRAPTDASAAPVPVVQGLQGPQAIVVDGTTIYFTTATDNSVWRLQPGGVPLALAVSQNWPKNIALAGNRVVWVNTDGTVMSVAK